MIDTQTITYNGWTNHETWLVNLWFNENQFSYQILRNICKQDVDSYLNAAELENLVQDQFEEEFESSDMWRDLMSSSLSKVNWVEIIENNKG